MPVVIALLIVFIVVDVVVLLKYIKLLRYVVRDDNKSGISTVSSDWSLLSVGLTDVSIEKAWLSTVQNMFTTFVKKNHDYGSDNLALAGIPGVVIRMGDKISRLFQLSGINGKVLAEVSSEGVKDTFLDLANYAICGYIMCSGKWPGTNTSGGNLSVKALVNLIHSMYPSMSTEDKESILSTILASEIASDLSARVKVVT